MKLSEIKRELFGNAEPIGIDDEQEATVKQVAEMCGRKAGQYAIENKKAYECQMEGLKTLYAELLIDYIHKIANLERELNDRSFEK